MRLALRQQVLYRLLMYRHWSQKVMDLKSPSSGEADKNLWENLAHLTLHDQIKIVIANRTDYEWAKKYHYQTRFR